MWVKQLIGRLAGTVVDLPFSAAENAIANGTAERATNDEVVLAGLDPRPVVPAIPANVLPPMYRAEPTEGGGFDLIDGAGLRLNEDPLPNMLALTEAAHAHLAVTLLPVTTIALDQVPAFDAPSFLLADYRFEPAEGGGFRLFDPAGLPLGDETVPDEEAARLGLRQHYAAALGLTLEELEAREAGEEVPTLVNVPADWRALHHTQKRALAQRITGNVPPNTAAAEEVIEEYLTRP